VTGAFFIETFSRKLTSRDLLVAYIWGYQTTNEGTNAFLNVLRGLADIIDDDGGDGGDLSGDALHPASGCSGR